MSAKRANHAEVDPQCDRSARTKANVWLTRHDLGLTPEEKMEFFQWLREDPRHETAWENCLKFWRRFDPRSGSEILFFVSQRRKPRSDRRSPVRPRQKEH